MYLGPIDSAPPNLQRISPSADVQVLALTSHLQGRYVYTPNFHVIQPDLRNRMGNMFLSESLLDFYDSLSGSQREDFLQRGIDVRNLNFGQLMQCMPLFLRSDHLNGLLHGSAPAYIGLRPALSVRSPEDPKRGSFPNSVKRYLVNPGTLRDKNQQLRRHETGSDSPKPWQGTGLTPVVPLEGAVAFEYRLMTLAEFVEEIELSFGISIRIDPRLSKHYVYIHGNVDEHICSQLVALLAATQEPERWNPELLRLRIDAFAEALLGQWKKHARDSMVDLDDDELRLFLEGATMKAGELDAGSGKFQSFFERNGFNYQQVVELGLDLDWHISSHGHYNQHDANGNLRRLSDGSVAATATQYGRVIRRN